MIMVFNNLRFPYITLIYQAVVVPFIFPSFLGKLDSTFFDGGLPRFRVPMFTLTIVLPSVGTESQTKLMILAVRGTTTA